MESMIRVTVKAREGGASRQLRMTAPSIVRAFALSRGSKPGHDAYIAFPIDRNANRSFVKGKRAANRDPDFPVMAGKEKT